MKKIIYNGKLYVEKGVFAQAALIEDGFLRVVGSNEEVLRAVAGDDRCERLDAAGRTVLPGINDSHQHLLSVCEWMSHCDLSSARSISDVVEIGRHYLKEHPGCAAVRGIGYNQDYFTDEKRPLTRRDLDRISTELPLVFCRVCGHILTVNSKALELLGITEQTPQVPGGVFERDENGRLNGIFCENAQAEAMKLLPSPTEQELASMYEAAMKYAVSVGITSVQSNDVTDDNARPVFRVLHKLHDEDKLLLRFHHQCCYSTVDGLRDFFETEFKDGSYTDELLTLGSLKLFADGSLGARTALLRRDYRDAPGTRGMSALSPQLMDELCALAAQHDFPIVTHAIGDGAIEQTLNSYEKVFKSGKNDLRHSLIHCQITDQPLLQRIAKLQVPCLVQPIFLDYDMHIADQRVGEELASTSYAFHTMQRLGVPVAYGTDAPVESCNPFPCIYSAVTRTDLAGQQSFYPSECVTVEDAVDCYTVGSAYAQFREDRKGRLKPGFLADLIILDRDIFTIPPADIPNIRVDLTMTGGRVVYRRE